jgi:uncharacterized delta-60 repeat protein
MNAIANFNRVFFLLIFFLACTLGYGQTCTPTSTTAGSLDSCFGTGGKVTTQISAGLDWARDVAVQPDGKIVVVGGANESSGPMNQADFGIVRYNTDGSLDTNFDSDGKVTTDFSGRADVAMSVKLQSDGKIVVAGVSLNYFALARYNTDGSVDNSFDNDGRVLTDFGSPIAEISNSMTIQTDGKIVVAGGGNPFVSSNSLLNVLRYNTDGSLDNSFDSDGKVVFSGIIYGKGIAIQPDGKILTTGSSNSKLVVARLNTDGSPDTTFGINGLATLNNGDRNEYGFALTVQSNGKIIVAGNSTINSQNSPLIVQFSANGAVDSSAYNSDRGISGLYIQPDGKILTAGFDDRNLSTGFRISRYNNVGLSDNTFNANQ